MKGLDYWRLADDLTIPEAAALIVGVDPGSMIVNPRNTNDVSFREVLDGPIAGPTTTTPREYAAALQALKRAVLTGRLEVIVMRDAWQRLLGEVEGDDERLPKSIRVVERDHGLDPRYRARKLQPNSAEIITLLEPHWGSTIVGVQEVRRWLNERGMKPSFFFPTDTSVPEYLDPCSPRYSSRLAAAVHAWIAVGEPKGQSPKKALLDWLRKNRSAYADLNHPNGEVNNAGIEECAKVANWKPDGGVPRTPG
ncbi:hypothetical protein [Rhizobacter fulvus]